MFTGVCCIYSVILTLCARVSIPTNHTLFWALCGSSIEEPHKAQKSVMNIYGRKCPLESCQDLVRVMLETLLKAEFCLFQEREIAAGRKIWRNGFARKTVRGRFGEITIRIPRDRAGLFEPRIVQKGFVLLGELEQTFLQIYGVYNSPRGGRLYVIRELISKIYSGKLERKTLLAITKAVVAACRSHKRLLVSVRCKPVGPGVRFRYEGVSAGYRREAASMGGGPVCAGGTSVAEGEAKGLRPEMPAESAADAESPIREAGVSAPSHDTTMMDVTSRVYIVAPMAVIKTRPASNKLPLYNNWFSFSFPCLKAEAPTLLFQNDSITALRIFDRTRIYVNRKYAMSGSEYSSCPYFSRSKTFPFLFDYNIA